MGILNATPDSFSDGGELDAADILHERIATWLEAGVDVFDVGGESTRPGHEPVAADEEVRRVVPVIQAVRDLDAKVPISIDTSKAIVARAALEAGADLVNDVSSLADAGMAGVVAGAGCTYIAMRSQDCRGDIVAACRDQLAGLIGHGEAAGIRRHAMVLDPGLGFGARPGPSVEDNLALVDGIADYAGGLPVLIGASRKRFVVSMAGATGPRDAVSASVDVAVRAARAGASIVRVHDVPETLAAFQAAGLR